MENATKALLMAAGILIGLLILSLASYLYISFGNQSKKAEALILSNQLMQYNAQYEIYNGLTDIKIHDIISVRNMAKENNKKFKNNEGFTDNYKVMVYLNKVSIEDNDQDLLNKYSFKTSSGEENQQQLFKCEQIRYHSNGRVSEIYFTK